DAQDALVFMRKDLDEARHDLVPILHKPRCSRTSSQIAMPYQHGMNFMAILILQQRLNIDGSQVASLLRIDATIIEDIGNTAAHPRSKVPSTGTQDDDEAIGHVLATVVANAFYHGRSSRITNGKAFACNSVQEDFATGRAVKHHITNQDALFRLEG